MFHVLVLQTQMAPLKLEVANSDGDRKALEEALDNFQQLGLYSEAEAAGSLLAHIRFFQRGSKNCASITYLYLYSLCISLLYRNVSCFLAARSQQVIKQRSYVCMSSLSM